MKYLISFAFISAACLMLGACKKNKSEVQTYPDYSGLKTGNYWVYQRFIVDTAGNTIPQNIYDSVYCVKDTIINNHTYFKMFEPGGFTFQTGYYYLRDSLHYIVSLSGAIVFSSEDFITVFRDYYNIAGTDDTVARIIMKMEDKDMPFTTPAGTFITSDFRESYYMYPRYSFADNPRCLHDRRAKGIGLVAQSFAFYASSPNYTERRLIRYKLN